MPVDYRIYDPAEGKTKNDYFREMLAEVLAWGLRPAFATGDGGYSGGDNLKTVKNHRMGFLFGVESNRLVSIEPGAWTQVARVGHPRRGREGLAARVRRGEAIPDVVERPAMP